ncbi:MAG: hypothetical protein Q7K43_00115 [Candidatus Woesearchaeota archaeon]|nr:hypothetical protein [Candidatus Woesearchaeota archaeon]
MQEIAKAREGECLSKGYINSQTNLDWKCKEAPAWKATPANIKRGKWCPRCAVKHAWEKRRLVEQSINVTLAVPITFSDLDSTKGNNAHK